jgi:hypothetical protein
LLSATAKVSRRRPHLKAGRWARAFTATLLEILVKDGVYDLDHPAPIPEWQTSGDPRAKIRIADILHMSSGLRIKTRQDPALRPILYLSGFPLPLHWWRRSYLIRLGVEKRGEGRARLTDCQKLWVIFAALQSRVGHCERIRGKLVCSGSDLWPRLAARRVHSRPCISFRTRGSLRFGRSVPNGRTTWAVTWPPYVFSAEMDVD